MIHNDHLATPQKLTDSSGTVIWAADYKPFGEATVAVSTITNNLRFPGQYFDAETGLNYNLNRDYNPAIGRYAEADPIGIRRGNNHLYLYVGDDPVNFSDPRGLTRSDPWYGYNDRDFQRWFHRCWKEKGGPRVTPEDEIAEAYDEWISRGSPKNGKCWNDPEPKQCEASKKAPSPAWLTLLLMILTTPIWAIP
jgi:RHS repeat-associated protein